MFFKSKLNAGIEINEATLHYAGVDPKSSQCHLWSAPLLETRESQQQRVPPEEMKSRLDTLLNRCRKEIPSFSKKVVVAIQRDILAGYLELPNLSDKELEVAVPTAARRQLPYSLDDVSLTFRKVPPLSGDGGKTGIFYLSVQKSRIHDVKNLIESSALEILSMDLAPNALVREFRANRKEEERQVVLAHVDFGQTLLLGIRKGHPYYYRAFSPAGSDFVYALQMGAQVSWPEAKSKLAVSDARNKETALEPVLGKWIREVQRSIKAFEQLGADMKTEELQLSGEGLWPGLAERLGEELGLPCKVNGWNQLKPADKQQVPDLESARYKIALGLALS